eukprot:scaffold179930_cov20-Tisochrysis_lutea.AAC.1
MGQEFKFCWLHCYAAAAWGCKRRAALLLMYLRMLTQWCPYPPTPSQPASQMLLLPYMPTDYILQTPHPHLMLHIFPHMSMHQVMAAPHHGRSMSWPLGARTFKSWHPHTSTLRFPNVSDASPPPLALSGSSTDIATEVGTSGGGDGGGGGRGGCKGFGDGFVGGSNDSGVSCDTQQSSPCGQFCCCKLFCCPFAPAYLPQCNPWFDELAGAGLLFMNA